MASFTPLAVGPRSSRRDWLKLAGLSGAAVLAGGPAALAQPTTTVAGRRRVLRLAHITDVHVEPERGAADGMASMLRHLQSQNDRPDLILNTGDHIYDSTSASGDRTRELWDLWHQIVSAELHLPMRNGLGNHDVWGWNKAKSKTSGDEPGWGKGLALEALGLSLPYYSFDQAGWHFVMLDSIFPGGHGKYAYHGRLDEQQFAWLEKDLAAVDPKTPVFVASHIPILSVTPLLAPGVANTGDFAFEGGSVHVDGQRLKALFDKHPNVKLAVSGHQHLIDRVDYNGVTYLCNGAVSGGWWKEKNQGDCDAGYTLIDLYDNGGFDRTYVTYGWTYRRT